MFINVLSKTFGKKYEIKSTQILTHIEKSVMIILNRRKKFPVDNSIRLFNESLEKKKRRKEKNKKERENEEEENERKK